MGSMVKAFLSGRGASYLLICQRLPKSLLSNPQFCTYCIPPGESRTINDDQFEAQRQCPIFRE